MRSSYAEWADEPSRMEFFRIDPPPRHLFEEERLKATIHFSWDSREHVGTGHWSQVFRVRMEHPDFTSQLKKKKLETVHKEAEGTLEVPFRVVQLRYTNRGSAGRLKNSIPF